MSKYLDLRGVPCPVNFVRCRLAIEQLSFDQVLDVYLDRGEPEEMIIPALKEEGHKVTINILETNWIRFSVISNGN